MKKILVCDDDKISMMLMERFLGKNYELSYASDGKESLDKINSDTYDLMLFDIRMPYRSGIELLEYVRLELKLKTPVFIISAFSNLKLQHQASILGADRYFLKPINFTYFVSAVDLILN